MIEVKKLSYGIPEKDLYKKVSFTIEDDAHYAFIGTNGTGKSTLVDMILNPDEYLYQGKIIFSEEFKNSRIGYVSQFSEHEGEDDMTVFDFIAEEFVALDQKIAGIFEQMESEDADFDALMEQYQELLDEKEAIDGDLYDVNIKKQLKLAGIEKLEQQKLSTLSGGEFKLIQVIKEMLLSPKIMFMDEPDVFLDFDHVNALVDLINSHKGTLVVITHNRYLLNHCFDKIIHLEDTDIQTFDGTYAEYNLELLSTKVELQEMAAKDEAEIARQQAIVDRVRAQATAMDNAALGRSVHARQSLLDRLQERKTKLPFIQIEKPEITFTIDSPIEEEFVLSLKDYEVTFDEQLLDHITFDMKPTDKVAIIGKNGTGKTTMLRDIWENQKGSIKISEQASVGIFSQVIGSLFGLSEEGEQSMDADKTVEKILDEHGFETRASMVEYLAKFNLVEENLAKKLSDLSGGERDLFQLAILCLSHANLLLLDEPTGHLDLYAQEALEEAIKNYEGGVLMVSHDFYIVANCMDYVLLVEDNSIRKMSIRRFRQRVYKNHFDKDYLLLEDQKKDLELRIEQLLEKQEYEKAKILLEQLEKMIQ